MAWKSKHWGKKALGPVHRQDLGSLIAVLLLYPLYNKNPLHCLGLEVADKVRPSYSSLFPPSPNFRQFPRPNSFLTPINNPAAKILDSGHTFLSVESPELELIFRYDQKTLYILISPRFPFLRSKPLSRDGIEYTYNTTYTDSSSGARGLIKFPL